MSAWLTAEQYEVLNAFVPEFTGFLLTVMDSNISVAKNIYEAQRSDLHHVTERVALLQQEVDELRRTVTRLLEEIQALRMNA